MILSCQNICKDYGGNKILTDISFQLEEREKAALVGVNGAGKSTLLRILAGEELPDCGQVTISKGKSVGYLAQQPLTDSRNTIMEELMAVKGELIGIERKLRETELAMKGASGVNLDRLMETYSSLTHQFETGGGYAYRSELTGVLKGLGFSEEEFDQPIFSLSGGQKTRVALGRLLLAKPDLILLDEPTNHLDMQSVQWLETYLSNYRGAVLIVSHDRYFLDRIAVKIIELDHAKGTVFSGNYSSYAAKKERLRAQEWKAYCNQQQEIKHQEQVIRTLRAVNRKKSIRRAESRQKALEKMDVLDKPRTRQEEMRLNLMPVMESGKDVLSVTGLSKSFGSRTLFEGLDFSLTKEEHVAILGENGTGKTTILRILNGQLRQDNGTVRFGANVCVGYFDQEQRLLHDEKTLFEEISDAYPFLTNTRIRSLLAAFLFTGEDAQKKVGELSGGERGRLSLAKLMLCGANLLILDEPTNHLDIPSKEILEDAVNAYPGTVLYVSHDRYFVNKTAHRILELANGALTGFLGGYDDYLEQKAKREAAEPTAKKTAKAAAEQSVSKAKLDWQAQKEKQARKRKRENDLNQCEREIDGLEKELERLNAKMADPGICTDAQKLMELARKAGEINESLTLLYQDWENLAKEEEA